MRHKTLTRDQHELVLKQLREAESLQSTVLQGHLYIEYWLNEVILKKWSGGQLIVDKFSFSQKVDIIEAVDLAQQGLIQSMREINVIRNRFAHDLFPEDIETKFAQLNTPLEEAVSTGSLPNGVQRFIFVITIISVFLLGICEVLAGTEKSDSLVPVFLLR